MDNATTDLDADVIDPLTLEEIKLLVSEFVAKLTPRQLTSAYWKGARLWMDTGDGEMGISFGAPRHPDVHPSKGGELTVGQWVWFGVEPDFADEHPVDEEGDRVYDWPELADWMRDDLEYQASWIAEKLEEEARLAH